MKQYDVFISYSRKDIAIADRICAAFDKAGISYFIDRQSIPGGMEFPEVLANAILDCDVFLFLASENSYESKFTNSEITFAFNEKEKNHIIPYIIDGSSLPSTMRFVFSAINWRNMTEHPIETVLVNDIMRMLRREAKVVVKSEEPSLSASEMNSKGDDAYNAGNYTEAVKWYRKAAEQGYAYAQYNLGFCYKYGIGIEKNFFEAVKWCLKSAEQENPYAQFSLGLCYEFAEGVEKNLSEAVKWYRKAAELGYEDAKKALERLENK